MASRKLGCKPLLACPFPAFGGLLFGYDAAYIGGVLEMPYLNALYLYVRA